MTINKYDYNRNHKESAALTHVKIQITLAALSFVL